MIDSCKICTTWHCSSCFKKHPERMFRRKPSDKIKELEKRSVGRPRSLNYVIILPLVWRQYHNVEHCGMGGGWSEHNCLSLHTHCPSCFMLAHLVSGDKSLRWVWACRLCGYRFAYIGEKRWGNRSHSPVVNGKRIHKFVGQKVESDIEL